MLFAATTCGRKAWILLATIIVLSPFVQMPFEWSIGSTKSSGEQTVLNPIHRTYWLSGDTLNNWNGTGRNPGPLITANDGDTVTIMLRSNDSTPHSWYLDFNDNLQLDADEVPTRSVDFNSNATWVNFTFFPTLAVIPHGGIFTYRCEQHPGPMFGDFKFYAGPIASFTHSPRTPLVGGAVSFDGSTSWPSTDHTLTTYTWNFGDSNTTSTSTPNASHTYSASQNFTATLTVTDNANQNASKTQTIMVKSIPSTPFDFNISILPDRATITQGNSAYALVDLSIESGATENVTLTIDVSPSTSTIQVSLNTTSGLPDYAVSMNISTQSSIQPGTYVITVIGLSDTGVTHNSTFTLIINQRGNLSQPPDYAPFVAAGTLAALSLLGVLMVRRRSKIRGGGSKRQPRI